VHPECGMHDLGRKRVRGIVSAEDVGEHKRRVANVVSPFDELAECRVLRRENVAAFNPGEGFFQRDSPAALCPRQYASTVQQRQDGVCTGLHNIRVHSDGCVNGRTGTMQFAPTVRVCVRMASQFQPTRSWTGSL
jgi:hypothetical protein